MKKIEEVEREHGVRSDESCRKPFFVEQLFTAIGGVFGSTDTIADNDLVHASEVENGYLVVSRWVRARFVGRVAQLSDKTEGAEELILEVLTIPSL